MIAEAGLAALWLAAALSLLGLFLSVAHVRGALEADRPVRALAVVQGLLCLFAFAMLLLVFARTDLSVALVAANSHSAKPFVYKVAAAWGNHEGSMLLWVTVLGLSGAALAALSHRLPSRTLIAALGAGFAPASAARKRNLNDVLRSGTGNSPTSAHRRLRSALVAGQIAISVVVLVCAAAVLRFIELVRQKQGGRA